MSKKTFDEHDGDNDNDNSIMIKTINTIDRPHGTRLSAINIDLLSIFRYLNFSLYCHFTLISDK